MLHPALLGNVMRLLGLICVCVVLGSAAQGGAWGREKGHGFVSTGANFLLSDGAELPVHYDPTTYAEYGLTDLVTVGLDYHTADKGQIHTGFVFAQFPLGDTNDIHRYSASLAFGARVDAVNPVETLLKSGVSWGRGLDRGWTSIDASATYGTIDQTFRPKVDFTWGRHLNDRWTTTVQLQTGQGYSDDYYAKINPSISFGINDRYRISLGAIRGLTGDEGTALKLDLWSTYAPGR